MWLLSLRPAPIVSTGRLTGAKVIGTLKQVLRASVGKPGILLLTCLGLSVQALRAQDVIYKAQGDSITSSVEEVNDNEVLYFDVPTTKSSIRKAISVKQIVKIRYANGYVELFESTPPAAVAVAAAAPPAATAAYDIMYTVSGSQLKVQVLEVDETSVTYRLLNAATVDKIATDLLIGIRYNNGFEEAYNAPAAIKQLAAAQAQNSAAPKASPAQSLDVIKLDNGREIQARIQEVDELNIYYTPADAAGAKRESVALDKVIKVLYANGYEEIYTVSKRMTVRASDEDDAPARSRPVAAPVPAPQKAGKVVAEKAVKVDKAEKNPERAVSQLFGSARKAPAEKAAKPVARPAEKPAKVAAQTPPKAAEAPTKAAEAVRKPVAPLQAQALTVVELADVLRKPAYTSLTLAAAEPLRVEYLDLKGTNLKALPAEVKRFKNLVAINLSKNNLRKFPAELLDLPSLQYVWLDETGLQSLAFDDGQLDKLKTSNIVFISAKNNRLTKLPSSVLTLANLRELKLGGNQISGLSLDKKFDFSQSYLQEIDLQNNRIFNFPTDLQSLPSLARLNVASNNIRTLDKETNGFKTLRSLKLNCNPIRKISPQLYRMPALEELDLNQTQITTLPDSIAKLTRLKVLVLPASFASFPADFGGLKLLGELRLNNSSNITRITAFPDAVLGCQRLHTLDISGANIKALPPEIARLKRLEHFYLSNCGLSALPGELFTLPRLKVLDLSSNRITQIKPAAGELAALETLNLRDSPVDGASLLALRRILPAAQMEYHDSDFGLNFTSAPLPVRMRPGFKKLFAACDKGDPAAYYELGSFFASSNDYGLAVKAYRVITDNEKLAGTGKSMTCLLSIAEIYDDVKNLKPYTSPYKRKQYADYDDYLNTSANNRAYLAYLDIARLTPRDPVARLAYKKGCARASIICNEIAENLEKIYARNNSEIERLIQGSGDMQNVSASGEKLMNDALVDNSEVGALLGSAVSIFGSISSAAKEDKSAKYKSQNVRLKADISALKSQATELAAK